SPDHGQVIGEFLSVRLHARPLVLTLLDPHPTDAQGHPAADEAETHPNRTGVAVIGVIVQAFPAQLLEERLVAHVGAPGIVLLDKAECWDLFFHGGRKHGNLVHVKPSGAYPAGAARRCSPACPRSPSPPAAPATPARSALHAHSLP